MDSSQQLMDIGDKRLIEDYLPIEAISAEASREKSVRKGHISTLHLWWARRPLVACRAAVYGALVPASRFVPNGGSDEKKKSLGRANSARFVKNLCRYPSDAKPEEKASIEKTIQEAQRHILIAHADRLTAELADWKAGKTAKPCWVDEFKWKGDAVTDADIAAGRAPRPRVLDMFAGGGAIPLEALRLGCEAYANDLNPVAHIIQLCTLVYPQKYGKPDPAARGMTGPKNEKGDPTWGGLADEVRYWGNWVLKKVKAEIGDLYPLVPDPEYAGKPPPLELDRTSGEWVIKRQSAGNNGKNAKVKADPFAPPQSVMGFAEDPQLRLAAGSKIENSQSVIPPGYLMPVAYLWTRTVKCKNPACGATVPLVKQTWLCKIEEKKNKKGKVSSPGRYVAMKMIAPKGGKVVAFDVVVSGTEKGLGFDPEAFSKAGNATCPFCGTVADSEYVKAEGCGNRMGIQFMAAACTRPGANGKVYLAAVDIPDIAPDNEAITRRIEELCKKAGLSVPDEPIIDDAKSSFWVRLYGNSTYGHLFIPRQMLTLLTCCAAVRSITTGDLSRDHAKATATLLAAMIDKLADFDSAQCTWNYTGGRGVRNTFPRQGVPMAWDFAETNPFNPAGASWIAILEDIPVAIDMLKSIDIAAAVSRGSATSLSLSDGYLDAVISDPPYYDNVSYADLSDFFFAWLKRSVGHLYPEHFSGKGAPKKTEAVSDASRHNGDQTKAKIAYEDMMAIAFGEAVRALKPGGIGTFVYAHKTTLGWATLVDALRRSGCVVVEAWPMDTERGARMLAMGVAALASSIFLVARKRDAASAVGNYETDVVPELADIVRERVDTLWDMGISGADLVIACVGAGLRAFTKYPRVEFANGEEVPAQRFLMEVETVVLETILGRLSKTVGAKAGTSLSGLDSATRFYVLWRYTYGAADLDAGEAIIFANGTHVELDGQHSLSAGTHALVAKKNGKYRLLDFTERGDADHLGRQADGGTPAPAVDALHRLMWLVEHKPPKIPEFLEEAKPNVEQLRLVAQALAGPALKGGDLADVSPTAEQSALGKLLANWNAVMVGKVGVADKRAGQQQLL